MDEWKDAMQTIQHKQNNTPLPSYFTHPNSLAGQASEWMNNTNLKGTNNINSDAKQEGDWTH